MDKDLLHIKAVREIITLVADGKYQQGEKLPAERDLCQQFGISRGTLRKALADLEKMGAVEIRPKSGAYIKEFAEKKLPKKILPKNFKGVDLKDIILARRAIEMACVELACAKIGPKELAELENLIEQMNVHVDNLPVYLSYDMAFHEYLVKASRNQVLITAFEAISEYHRYSQIFSSTDEQCETDSLEHHRRILESLQKKNGKKAVDELKLHFDSMMKSAV